MWALNKEGGGLFRSCKASMKELKSFVPVSKATKEKLMLLVVN